MAVDLKAAKRVEHRVRAFRTGDISQVADLHRRVFGVPPGVVSPEDAYHAYFTEVFLQNPWASPGPPSLVCEDARGKIVGFVGVMGREFVLEGRPVRAALTSQFIVEPTQRATLAGIALVKALLSGPQDFTFADEAVDLTRRIWEGLGGTTSRLFSLYWTRVLRPAELALRRWGRGRRAWIPLVRIVDTAVMRLPGNPMRVPVQATPQEDLSGEGLASCITQFAANRALHPVYDGRTAGWLLDILARKPGSGILRTALVRTAGDEIAGWYVYCGRSGGIAEVLQFGAREDRVGDVFDHLFAQAWQDRMVALSGRIDPSFANAFTARGCVFHHRGFWTLVHARNQRVLQVIHRGDVFLTRLEGEWCMRFQVA